MVCASKYPAVNDVGSGPIPLSFVLRDRGNGVTRVESSQLVDLPSGFRDAVEVAMSMLTVCGPAAYLAGCCRSVTEYYFW